MKTFRYLLVGLLSLSVIACTKTGVELPDPNDSPGNSFNVDKAVALQLVNNIRNTGCNCGSDYMPPVPPVTWNDKLAFAAQDHSRDMYARNVLSHTGTDGSNAGTRITRRGYIWRTYGENIASGYRSEQDVINGWINSPGHCRNIMNGAFTEMGMAREGNYWTQELARHQ